MKYYIYSVPKVGGGALGSKFIFKKNICFRKMCVWGEEKGIVKPLHDFNGDLKFVIIVEAPF